MKRVTLAIWFALTLLAVTACGNKVPLVAPGDLSADLNADLDAEGNPVAKLEEPEDKPGLILD